MTDWNAVVAEMDREDARNENRQQAIKRKMMAVHATKRQEERGHSWYRAQKNDCTEDDYSEESFP